MTAAPTVLWRPVKFDEVVKVVRAAAVVGGNSIIVMIVIIVILLIAIVTIVAVIVIIGGVVDRAAVTVSSARRSRGEICTALLRPLTSVADLHRPWFDGSTFDLGCSTCPGAVASAGHCTASRARRSVAAPTPSR